MVYRLSPRGGEGFDLNVSCAVQTIESKVEEIVRTEGELSVEISTADDPKLVCYRRTCSGGL